MRILAEPIFDNKIGSYNVMTQMTVSEYIDLVKSSIKKNELQRPRVRSSKSIYANLKEDLKTGCVIPPIVLSFYSDADVSKMEIKELESFILEKKDRLFILDGLQRTYTIQDMLDEQKGGQPVDTVIRVEIYLGLNREGVLYRMLTLNTGQTPMSLRHQIEIIYLDLLDNDNDYGITFIRDTDGKQKQTTSFYFNEAVDAFTSFISQDYLQITREKLLSTIESFDSLSKLKDEKDVFLDLMSVFSKFMNHIDSALIGKDIGELMQDLVKEHLYGESTLSIFNKSQTLTGYAAAIAKLIEIGIYDDVQSVANNLDTMDNQDILNGVVDMLVFLDEIRRSSKKIGNAQRCFFYYFFKSLFDTEDEENYMNCVNSVKKAKQNYKRDN